MIKRYKKRKPRKVAHRKLRREDVHQSSGVRHTFLFVFVTIIFLGISSYTIFYTSLLHVREIIITGAQRQDISVLTTAVREISASTPFFGVAGYHFFRINPDMLAQDIVSQFPIIESVVVRKIFPQTLDIVVHEYDYVLRVCTEVIAEDQCVQIDHEGYFLQKLSLDSAEIRENPFITIITTQRDLAAYTHDDVVIIPDVLTNIIMMQKELAYTVRLKTDNVYTLLVDGFWHLSVNVDEGWYIIFDGAESTAQSITSLQTLFKKTELAHERKNLEYVDLRFGKKIFYKKQSIDQEKEDLQEGNVFENNVTPDSVIE